MNWQTPIAAGIVAITAGIFLFRLIRSKKKSGCGGSCDCGKSRKP